MKKLGKYKKLAIASLSAIALAASIAVAQSVKTDQDKGQRSRPEWQGGRGERGDHAWGGMRGGLFSKLNLTDDQKAKIKQIHESFAERNKPLREQLHAKRQELSAVQNSQRRTAQQPVTSPPRYWRTQIIKFITSPPAVNFDEDASVQRLRTGLGSRPGAAGTRRRRVRLLGDRPTL